MYILPESCLEVMVRTYQSRSEWYNPVSCMNCKNALPVDFLLVVKKRVMKRRPEVNPEAIKRDIFPGFIKHMKENLIRKYQNRELIDEIFKEKFSPLI